MVETGSLGGQDAEPPRRMRWKAIVHKVVAAAESQDDIELFALWHALGWDVLLGGVAGDDPRDIPALVGFARWPSERARCLSSCAVGYVRCSMSTTRSRSKIVGQAAIEHRADSAAGV
ncbi:hypothetical protein ACRS5S_07995 [Nocardia asiatica]|uniref:hypothetical protein n=1 Tax=Nocardia asiatica TaxID=209252 RepID=UPI003EE2CA33